MNEPQSPDPASEDEVSGKLSVETWSESNEALQSFVVDTWSQAYAGKMSFPVWSKDYFDWQFARQDAQPDRRLVVCDSGRIVAALLGTPAGFRTPDRQFRGAHWSWLSVAGSHRGQGLATLLDEARVSLERKAGSELIVSYRFTGSKHSLAEQPSKRFPLKRFHGRVGFWARPLDGRRLQKWNTDPTEGFLSRIATPLLPAIRTSESGNIRDFEPDDLADCLESARQQFQDTALSIDWDAPSLMHQLCGNGVPQTIVSEHDGQVRGFINFHLLPFQGRTLEQVGVIDIICARRLPAGAQLALLKRALGVMREQGAILALKIRSGDAPVSLLLRSGFMPRLPDSSLVLQWTQTVQDIPGGRPLHLLWR